MKRVLIIILSIFLMVISISSYGFNLKSKVYAIDYTGEISYSESKPSETDKQGYLGKYINDLESIKFSILNIPSEYVTISRIKTSYLTSSQCDALYGYLTSIPSDMAFFNVPVDLEVRFSEHSIYYSFPIKFYVKQDSITKHSDCISFDVLIKGSSFRSLVLEGEALEYFLDLFSYDESSVGFYFNIIDRTFSATANWLGGSYTLSLLVSGSGRLYTILNPANMSVKLDFKFKSSYRVGKIYILYSGVGFYKIDSPSFGERFLAPLWRDVGAKLYISIGVNNGDEIFAYESGTTKKSFAELGFEDDFKYRHLLLTFNDSVRIDSVQLYLYNFLCDSDFSVFEQGTLRKYFGYGVSLQYLQLYGQHSSVIIPPGGGDPDRLIDYYEDVEWYDIPAHLHNFMVWLIYDCPIISPIFSMIYAMFSFSEVFVDNFLLFSSLGTIFVIIAGLFGLMIIIKVLKD